MERVRREERERRRWGERESEEERESDKERVREFVMCSARELGLRPQAFVFGMR